ncbi:hypothetical protein ATW7_13603 [Alteromonadales bacterium TW-7]|nr:hypothetical protein ATW7_13603 [Alteromonadales bacterium TW-7]
MLSFNNLIDGLSIYVAPYLYWFTITYVFVYRN